MSETTGEGNPQVSPREMAEYARLHNVAAYGALPSTRNDTPCACAACFVPNESMPFGGLYSRMFICPTCGNKRCPKATYHRLDCTGSNEPNQPGSRYQHAPEQDDTPCATCGGTGAPLTCGHDVCLDIGRGCRIRRCPSCAGDTQEQPR